jgi:glucokinase
MQKIRTITASEMRGINRTAILELIRRKGPTSRSYIAQNLQISLPTVMRIVDELIEEKLVRELGETEWSGGRRRTLIELNAKEHLTVGLDLGGTKFYGAVTDLSGCVLFEQTLARHNTKGEESYTLMVELITQLLEQARGTGKSVMGIAIGVPGVTYHDRGVIEWAPSLEWRDFPLEERVRNHFGLPAIVDNDVNLAALGEVWFGAGRDASNLIVINIGTGIGAGVVIDGAIYRGAHQMAGEIGYLLPGREYLAEKYPDFGALELLAAGTGIAQRAQQVIQQCQIDLHIETVTVETVFDAYRRDAPWAIDIIEETTDYLAIAIAAVTTFFDPEVIVLGGGVVNSADLLIPPILKQLQGRIPLTPTITASSLGNRGAVLGGMINLLHNISDFYIVRKLS